MRHVFVETNWVYSFSAPAHHKRPDAVELLERAKAGEIRLHLPAICLMEARRAILTKCQPRKEADALQFFLLRARTEQALTREDEQITRIVLDRFEQQVQTELRKLDQTLAALMFQPGIEIFPLNERMLERSLELSAMDLILQPFD